MIALFIHLFIDLIYMVILVPQSMIAPATKSICCYVNAMVMAANHV